MKKLFLSALLIFTFAIYILHDRKEESESAQLAIPSPTSVPQANTPQPTTMLSNTPSDTPVPPTHTSAGRYKDGTYAGIVADAFYGNVEVQATIQSGKITDVQFLQFPSDRRTSREISAQAMPLLKQEAIVAQNEQVDIVSGATQTSLGFRKSLQSALDQAKNG